MSEGEAALDERTQEQPTNTATDEQDASQMTMRGKHFVSINGKSVVYTVWHDAFA